MKNRIAVIGWDHDEPESLSLQHVGGDLGFDVTLVTLDDVAIAGPHVRLADTPVADFDGIIIRAQLRASVWAADYERLLAVSDAALRWQIPVIDPAPGFVAAESKYLQTSLLAHAGIPVPVTQSCSTVEEVTGFWRERAAPIVVKPSRGYGGENVLKYDGPDQDCVVAALLHTESLVLAQEFLAHPHGDIRVTLVGDEVVAAFRRLPAPHEFRVNITLGGSMSYAPIPEAAMDLARRASRAVGIAVSGVDLIEVAGKLVVLEVNNCPGWDVVAPEQQRIVVEQIYRYLTRLGFGS